VFIEVGELGVLSHATVRAIALATPRHALVVIDLCIRISLIPFEQVIHSR
jgi:hypothetical protein